MNAAEPEAGRGPREAGGWPLAADLGLFDGTCPRSPLTRTEAAAVFLRMGLLARMQGGAEAQRKAEEMGMD